MSFVETQIVFIFKKDHKIHKTYFLTYKDDLKNDKTFELFQFLLKNQTRLFASQTYEILENHILLSLNLGEIRGYLQHQILKSDEKILVFSLWDNIDFSSPGGIFSPFNYNSTFQKNPDSQIIYEVYKNVASGAIFCVLPASESVKQEVCRDGTYDPNIYPFVNSVLQNLKKMPPIELHIDEANKYLFDVFINEDDVYYMKKVDFFDKCINWRILENIYISGSQHTLLDPDIPNDSYKIDVFNKDGKILEINNQKCIISNIEKYKAMTSVFPKLENIIIKETQTKMYIKIIFSVELKQMEFDTNLPFFITLNANLRNIFYDRIKSINIIMASRHFSFQSNDINLDLFGYYTYFFLGYQDGKKNVLYTIRPRKTDDRYFSRYCQGIRRPVELEAFEDVNLSDYRAIGDSFYTSDMPNKADIFITETKIFTCMNDSLKIGFIDEIAKGYNICLPCCYKKEKMNTQVFKTCTGTVNQKVEKLSVEPFFHSFKQYRVIVDPGKLGLLLDKTAKFFNTSNSSNKPSHMEKEEIFDESVSIFCIERKNISKYQDYFNSLDQYVIMNKKRIEGAKNYIIYTADPKKRYISDELDISTIKDKCFFFSNDNILCSNDLVLEIIKDKTILEQVELILLTQTHFHLIKSLNKNFSDTLRITDVSIEVKKRVFEKILESKPFLAEKQNQNNLKLTPFFFYKDNQAIDLRTMDTKYYYSVPKILLKEDSLGHYITDILYSKFFQQIQTQNMKLYKIIWLLNLEKFFEKPINFNVVYSFQKHENIINELKKFLNPRFFKKP
ncbi:putative viral early transcription factor large subunit [Diachasmimorpha longicaudata entomopoxvirus]|uniref:Early transcription factor 82 kDa subunit n=1 Tax=Diachasmimorpha longicaudata entomopoxvirus TaxID=109981 RepID=A0A7R5WF63_9POXV|nr:putative viral early transcription factor large subunit [Diachasmimorpha longicaudata entomopoxvirus]AKS26355.1 putative viral early transcription factor large subunit [Diachasmimorpha longicaudata entomopoxvirus]